MHLSLDPILLLGTALPESFEAAFVVARVADFQLLLNPNDGFCYRLNDPLVPIISVATAVVVENHFANIQSAQHPSQLSFDLKVGSQRKTSLIWIQNSLHWRPLFSARSKPDFTSVQSSYLSYNVISEDVLLELRAGLEREIKVQFDESRRFGIPQWNLSAARTLREILIEFDARDSLPPDIETRLQYLRGSFKTNVIACKLPYTSREDVFQVVSATNFSLNANRNSQFAVAVHISPFFGGVLQISIALAALIPP
ncbi:hypothetical protein L596_007529 [Steinernema carpocapsae]|uniref:CEP76/DRC7 peptidase-like domain-containing protein n=1 Tax=Steinernema carpocapsae TaxID=34508 RepID=A0A4U5P9N2_STECR|nr:hypothetical protein L596_007529 [Steinernema carpocapsae]